MFGTEDQFEDRKTGKVVIVPTDDMLRQRYNSKTRRANRKARLKKNEKKYQKEFLILVE
jgi:hypothetical protein